MAAGISEGIEKGDHCEDAPMIIVGLWQAQLAEDVTDVLFHRPLGDPEPVHGDVHREGDEIALYV